MHQENKKATKFSCNVKSYYSDTLDVWYSLKYIGYLNIYFWKWRTSPFLCAVTFSDNRRPSKEKLYLYLFFKYNPTYNIFIIYDIHVIPCEDLMSVLRLWRNFWRWPENKQISVSTLNIAFTWSNRGYLAIYIDEKSWNANFY